MSFPLTVLVVGVCFICGGAATSEVSSNKATEDLNFNLTEICGFKRCAESQCCVGTSIVGYCLDSPKEGQPCAIRANVMEEFFCGRCGLKSKCIEGRCRKPPSNQNLYKSNIIQALQD